MAMKGVAGKTPVTFRVILRGLLLVVGAAPGVFWRLVALSLIYGAGPDCHDGRRHGGWEDHRTRRTGMN